MWWIISGIVPMTSGSAISWIQLRPYCFATISAHGSSERSWSLTPMENVSKGLPAIFAVIAVTSEESMPPERNVATGTSESRCSFTVSRRSASSSSVSSSAEPVRLGSNVARCQ